MKKNYLILASVLALAVIIGVTIYTTKGSKTPDSSNNSAVSSPPISQTPSADTPPNGEPITLEGVMTCLVPKDTTGVNDMSCAIGLKTDDGKYYALNASDPTLTGGIPTGDRVTVKGSFSAKTTKYTMEGVVQVESINRL